MSRNKIFFICDAHLGSGTNEEQKERTLIKFIKSLPPESVSGIYILGDLFDFWFEYKSVILSQYFRVLSALAEAVESGIDVHLVTGNHDFWAGEFLQKTIGVKVHRDPIEMELDGLRVYMCHGDGLNPHDRSYQVLKAVIRNRVVIWLARRAHPDTLMRMARWFSRFSRESSSVAGKLREDEGISRFAMKKFHDGTDVVIAGHSHQPHDETYSINGMTKQYYNIGDMQQLFSYLEYSNGKFELKYLDREKESDEPRTAN